MTTPNILICAPFMTLPGEPGANRFVTLARRLAQDYNVTLVTSRFCHSTKCQRSRTPDLQPVRHVMIDEPGYRQNVSFERLWSHWHFCRNLEKYLATAPNFDLVYSAFPLVQTNLILGARYKSYSVPLVIDVQDVWPEAITGAVPALSGRLGRLLMSGLIKRSDRAYAMADALVAVSHTYLKRADVSGLPEDRKVVAYIGSDRLWFDNEESPIQDKMRPMKAVYLGSLGGSYDIETLVRAAAMAPSVEVEIIGSGPFEEKLRALNSELGGRVHFTGALPYVEAMARTRLADIAINAIKTSALQSVTNKLSDYFCAGLPILSSQVNDEVNNLLGRGGGRTYNAGDAEGLARLMMELAEKPEERWDMARCNRAIARELFLRSNTYEAVVGLINRVLNNA